VIYPVDIHEGSPGKSQTGEYLLQMDIAEFYKPDDIEVLINLLKRYWFELRMSNKSQKISIITVTLNSDSTIEKTIQSVINQTYPNIEYIIIDGGSTDNTHDILKNYHEDIDILIIEKDDGIYDAMNKGVKIGSGDFIYFLHSGDLLYESTVIEKIMEKINNKNEYDIFYGDFVYYDNEWEEFHSEYRKNKAEILIRGINHQSMITRASFFKKNGFFNVNNKIYSDFEWLIKAIFENQARIFYLDLPIVYYLKGGESDQKGKEYHYERSQVIHDHVTWDQLLFFAIKYPLDFYYYVKDIVAGKVKLRNRSV